jgi:hypothetical protein
VHGCVLQVQRLLGVPPEAIEGIDPTAAADVYAAGMVIYEACDGTRWPAYQPPGEAEEGEDE